MKIMLTCFPLRAPGTQRRPSGRTLRTAVEKRVWVRSRELASAPAVPSVGPVGSAHTSWQHASSPGFSACETGAALLGASHLCRWQESDWAEGKETGVPCKSSRSGGTPWGHGAGPLCPKGHLDWTRSAQEEVQGGALGRGSSRGPGGELPAAGVRAGFGAGGGLCSTSPVATTRWSLLSQKHFVFTR